MPNGKLTFKWDKALRDGSAVRDEPSVVERWEAWVALKCPTLLVRGDDSDILSPETAKRMVEENANVTLSVVPDCGHSITLDRPVREVMDPPFPVVDDHWPLDRLSALLSRETPAALVRHDGQLIGILTRYDLLHQISGIR